MGKRTQIKILDALNQADRTIGMASVDIARAIGKPPGTLQSDLARLRRQGLVEARWQGQRWPSEGGLAIPIRSDRLVLHYYRLMPQTNEDSILPKKAR